MRKISDEKGLTLIEILVSIVLLTFVLVSFFYFFINAANYNSMNGQELKGINKAREWLVTIQQSGEIKDLLKKTGDGSYIDFSRNNYSLNLIEDINDDNDDYYILKIEDDMYKIVVFVWKDSEFDDPSYIPLHQTLIKVYDKDVDILNINAASNNPIPLSDTYGYIGI